MTPGYTRRRWTYSFRAWIDGLGFNADRAHEREYRNPARCKHAWMWDLNRTSDSRNIIRVERRSSPRYLHVLVGRNYRTVLRIGHRNGV